MDKTTIIIIAIFAVISIVALLLFRQRAKIKITGPLDTKFILDATNQLPPINPAVSIEDAKSNKGSLIAEDSTGTGAHVKRVEVERNISVSSKPPQINNDPKA